MVSNNNIEKEIEFKLSKLSDQLKIEALRYIDQLIEKHSKDAATPFQFKWKGALAKKIGGQYSAVDLQHKSLEWR